MEMLNEYVVLGASLTCLACIMGLFKLLAHGKPEDGSNEEMTACTLVAIFSSTYFPAMIGAVLLGFWFFTDPQSTETLSADGLLLASGVIMAVVTVMFVRLVAVISRAGKAQAAIIPFAPTPSSPVLRGKTVKRAA